MCVRQRENVSESEMGRESMRENFVSRVIERVWEKKRENVCMREKETMRENI